MTYKYDPVKDIEAVIDGCPPLRTEARDALIEIVIKLQCLHEHVQMVDFSAPYRVGELSIPDHYQALVCMDCGAEVEEE